MTQFEGKQKLLFTNGRNVRGAEETSWATGPLEVHGHLGDGTPFEYGSWQDNLFRRRRLIVIAREGVCFYHTLPLECPDGIAQPEECYAWLDDSAWATLKLIRRCRKDLEQRELLELMDELRLAFEREAAKSAEIVSAIEAVLARSYWTAAELQSVVTYVQPGEQEVEEAVSCLRARIHRQREIRGSLGQKLPEEQPYPNHWVAEYELRRRCRPLIQQRKTQEARSRAMEA